MRKGMGEKISYVAPFLLSFLSPKKNIGSLPREVFVKGMPRLKVCEAFTIKQSCARGSRCPFWHVVPTIASESFLNSQDDSPEVSFRPSESCDEDVSEAEYAVSEKPLPPKAAACAHCHQVGCLNLKCLGLSAATTTTRRTEVPVCRECGQHHTEGRPIPWMCYHQGRWVSPRYGGWALSERTNTLEWHCCGCEDPTAKNCLEHKIFRTCHCFDRPGEDRRERQVDKLWISHYTELGWPVEELAEEAGLAWRDRL